MTLLDRARATVDTHNGNGPVDPFASGSSVVSIDQPGSEPLASSAVDVQASGDIQSRIDIDGIISGDLANDGANSKVYPPIPGPFDELRVLAECFADVQKVRIAIGNRTKAKKLKDGTVIPPSIDPFIVADAIEAIDRSERLLGSAMRKSFKRAAPDLYKWTKDTVGIGEHLLARLIGIIGDPVVASPHHWEGEGDQRTLIADPPFIRNVAKLWAYCGHGDPARRKAKGMTADEAMALGNPRAKMIVHLIAEGAMKCVGSASPIPEANNLAPTDASCDDDGAITATSESSGISSPRRRRSPYRDVYDLARAEYATRDDWTDAHRHNAALRLVGKQILADLYNTALETMAEQP